MQRMGMVIGLEPAKIAEYKALHAAVWPEILALMTAIPEQARLAG